MGRRRNCVNALSRAPFISTKEGTEEKVEKIMCQCPISGSLHFYIPKESLNNHRTGCVNALSRAPFISTTQRKQKEHQDTAGVNALSRAPFISTKETKATECPWYVSMPYLGLPSFLLPIFHESLVDFVVCVNALSRAPFISTEQAVQRHYRRRTVSMPYLGLPSFLPPPLKLLDFMRCSSLVFAHICQNILKYCYFIALF